ncbi:hypothetical protein PDJAM_G00179230 [Pangasius djambal]|uniref:Uncharacterized protein n=1 Tax=Pangasius djambal TaxID=1691987 RepID=A0ACC5ZQ27_9TELE|nr:hypothetical protein [Pangasius djambal]
MTVLLHYQEAMKSCEYQQIDALSTPAAGHTPAPPRPCQEKQQQQQPRRVKRKWEVFPGKNRFYCDGRIMVARQSGVLPLTMGLILVTSGLFFVFDCPFLVEHLTGCIPVIGGVLFVFVVISLLQTSFTDPGILPRATPEEAADIEKQIDNPNGCTSSYRPPPRTKEVVINQQRFDHHCPWVGNCVGKRNYRFFYMFIVSLSFLTAFIFGCVTTHLALRSQGGNGLVFALQASPARYPFGFHLHFATVSCLSGFHTYLVAANLTTNEDIKGSWSGKSGNDETGNPYSYHNIFKNCCSVLCGPMPPSLIDRRGFVSLEDVVHAGPTEIGFPAAKNDINMVGRVSVSGHAPLPISSTLTFQQSPLHIQSHSTA